VLSIAKLRVGAEAYQLTGVAQSLADYYSGAGEVAGWWAGGGAERLGLTGEVSGDDLRALLAGIQPGAGGLSPNGETIRPHPRRVPGFDLTFKAPKSVSVLYGVTDDPRVQGVIIEAGEQALLDTLAWVEREVMAVRRGSDDRRYLVNLAARDPAAAEAKRVRVERGADLIAAVFRHRTSRAGDPLLHWHVLIPNLVRGHDGRWSAFVHPDLYRLQRAAGEVFQAALRDQLTRALGVRWRPGRHVPEVEGIGQGVLDALSKRSAEIDAWLDQQGRGQDPAARQAAVLATRRGKAELEGVRFDVAWKLEGTHLGFGPEQADQLLAELERTEAPDDRWRLPDVSLTADGTPYTHDRTVTAEDWISDLLARDLLTRDATFTHARLYEAVARRLGNGATVTTIDRITSRVLASDQVIPIAPNHSCDTVSRWTSTVMAATERRLLDAFDQRDRRDAIPLTAPDRALAAYPTLGPDQAAAVRMICTSTDPVAVLIGPAGTGKTHTLAAVTHALRHAGLQPVGAAPSARAAVELEAGTAMSSVTLHALTRRWARLGEGPTARTVLIIDETAMAATVDLEPLITRTIAAGGRVILVGDHHQLPEIGPGGALTAAAEHCRAVAELTINRRQVEPWEHEALAHLRAGSVPAAVAAYRAHDRVIVTSDHDAMLAVAVERYMVTLADGHRPVLMAGTNETVARLNTAVRQRLAELHALDLGSVLAASGGGEFVVGDRVVLRHNARISQPGGHHVSVRNSDVATVLRGGEAGGIVVRRDNDHAVLTVDAGYLRGGWVDHGYAVTAHRAQGGTWDHAIAVGADGLYREAAYVQLSRGRYTNTLVIPQAQMDDLDAQLERHATGIPLPGEEPVETMEGLIDRIESTRAKLLALSRDPHADRVAALADAWTLPVLEAHAHRARYIEHRATEVIGIHPDVLTSALERAHHTAHHVALGQRVKAYDRNNIGTVSGIDDDNGTIAVWFESHTGRTAVRTLPWTEVQIVDRSLLTARVLPARAMRILDDLALACSQTLEQWRGHVASGGVNAGDATRYERAAQLLIARESERLAAVRPAWLTGTLGGRPASAHGVRLRDQAVEIIAAYRLRRDLPDHTAGLGLAPALGAERLRDWTNTRRQLTETRHQLDRMPSPEPQPHQRTVEELRVRHRELQSILDTAPPDVRELVATLGRIDEPSLIDAQAELRSALNSQTVRRAWILEHWPHVVEYAEVRAALHAGTTEGGGAGTPPLEISTAPQASTQPNPPTEPPLASVISADL
jgi:conjugative relaxase-like TrwC/TraI family protein